MATLSRASKMAWYVPVPWRAHAYERPCSVPCWTCISPQAMRYVEELLHIRNGTHGEGRKCPNICLANLSQNSCRIVVTA